jgi:protein-serine/threonine kinase
MSDSTQSDLAVKVPTELAASDKSSLAQQARHDSRVHHDVGSSTLDHSHSPTDALQVNSHTTPNSAQTGGGGTVTPLTDANKTAHAHNHAILPTIDTGVNHTSLHHRVSSIPALAGLTIQTKLDTPADMTLDKTRDNPTISETQIPVRRNNSLASPPAYSLPARGSSLRSNLSTASISSSLSPGSANSALPSPYLATMSDLTPLPSPLVGHEAPWKRTRPRTPGHSRNASLEEQTPTNTLSPTIGSPGTPSKRKKGYGSLVSTAVETSMAINTGVTQENRKQTAGRHHSRNRSISDFQPEQLHNVRQRHVTIGAGDAPGFEAAEYRMQREAYLAAQRGLTQDPRAPKQIPSPPPSNTSVAESDEHEEDTDTIALNANGEPAEYLQIHCGINNRKRRFRKLRQLGQGTFSKVVLATSERILESPAPANIEEQLDPARLVAVKIVEHGPAGGADKERIDTSLRREVEMLKNISHPSLVHLKACEHQDSRTLLVLTYCSGGDLFEVASSQREVLTPPMVQRMFSELVSALRYLHTNWIVHRDIKLENVLVNFPPRKLEEISDPLSFPEPIVTLTDLGLSRRIPDPPESPLLTTRCGSEDYAAPEILLGQPYDGRHTDAWALGVLLYALMEGRLPFDAPPNKPERSRNTHRIARCDWIWCRFGDEDGEWDPSRGGDWDGARECVEGLLKKVRMGRRPLEDIEGLDWVKNGVAVPGGLQMRHEDRDEMN